MFARYTFRKNVTEIFGTEKHIQIVTFSEVFPLSAPFCFGKIYDKEYGTFLISSTGTFLATVLHLSVLYSHVTFLIIRE